MVGRGVSRRPRRRVLAASLPLALLVGLLATQPAAARPETLGRGVDATVLTLQPPGSPAPPRPVDEQAVAQSGTGELVVVSGVRPASVREGALVTYHVRVEKGLTVRGRPVDADAFAATVHAILGDRRGWQPIDQVRFRAVDAGPVDVEVVLASPDTTDALCAPLGTGGWLSCYNGSAAVLNARRWFAGAPTYGKDLAGYRRYLVSHEVGHFLGHQHVGCPAPGTPAPVMVQQTKSLEGCTAHPWPAAPRPRR